MAQGSVSALCVMVVANTSGDEVMLGVIIVPERAAFAALPINVMMVIFAVSWPMLHRRSS